MKSVAILLVCIYALSTEGAPTFSETFNATLLVQYVGGTASAKVVRDANAGKQYWAIYSELENSYVGQIFDYGAKQSYNIIKFGPMDGCMPLAINGSLPKFWDWVGKAKDAGKTNYMDTGVEVWAGRDNAGNYHEVGVSPSDPTRPVYTVVATNRTAIQYTWLEYSETVTPLIFDLSGFGCRTSSHTDNYSAIPGMMTPFRLGVMRPKPAISPLLMLRESGECNDSLK